MTIKSMARGLLGEVHWSFLMWHRERFGLARTLRVYVRAALGGGRAHVAAPSMPKPVTVRLGTADQSVYDEIFVQGEYALDLGDPAFIIDAGAHIGLASVYLATRHPRATIVALEPEPSNFAMLVHNARPYPNIHTLNVGLWSHTCRLAIENPSADTWAFRVKEVPGPGGIPAVGVDDVLKHFGQDRIDVLKIDIEGSEVEVLHASASWIGKVRTLIVETHDRMRPGCTAALDEATRHMGFQSTQAGEKTVLRRATTSHET